MWIFCFAVEVIKLGADFMTITCTKYVLPITIWTNTLGLTNRELFVSTLCVFLHIARSCKS